MEATMFPGWIYDHRKPHAAAVKVAHPRMLRAIAAAKKKNDRIDAGKICGGLRCDFLPESYMASTAIRERRRTLRYGNLLERQMVQMKIKISALWMAAGVSYNKQRLHKAGYFRETAGKRAQPFIDVRGALTAAAASACSQVFHAGFGGRERRRGSLHEEVHRARKNRQF